MTRDLVTAERIKNSCATLREIGDKFGISRERVRQILAEENLPTVSLRKRFLCNYCGKVIRKQNKLFCNTKCFHEYTQVTLTCDYCGESFNRGMARVRGILRPTFTRQKGHSVMFFCNNICKGKYAGANYGFMAHPENAGKGRKEGKE